MEQENVFSDADSELENELQSESDSESDDAGSCIDNKLDSDAESACDNKLESPIANKLENRDHKTFKPDIKTTTMTTAIHANQRSKLLFKPKRSVRFSKKIEFDDQLRNKQLNSKPLHSNLLNQNIAHGKSNLRKSNLRKCTVPTKSDQCIKTDVKTNNVNLPLVKTERLLAKKITDKSITHNENIKTTDTATIKKQFEKMIMSYPTLAEMITIQEIIAELEVYQEQHRKFRASLAVIIDWLKTPNMINLCKAKAKVAALNMIYDDGTKFLQHINDKFDEINIDI
jgi:hypothetical protein